MKKNLQFSVYREPNDRAEVVFRKKNVLYRIGILGISGFLLSLSNYLLNMQRALVLQLEGRRMRKWVLELGLIANDNAVLQVWEMAGGEMKPCFAWAGTAEELQRAIRRR